MPNELQDKLAEVFPYFCRRVCLTCNGGARNILESCPIIKLDAFLWLRDLHNNGNGRHPSQHLTKEVRAIITNELVISVSNNGLKKPSKSFAE